MDPTFGTLVREARLRRGETQRSLAARVGITGASVHRIEVDDRLPFDDVAKRIVDALDGSIDAVRAMYQHEVQRNAKPMHAVPLWKRGVEERAAARAIGNAAGWMRAADAAERISDAASRCASVLRRIVELDGALHRIGGPAAPQLWRHVWWEQRRVLWSEAVQARRELRLAVEAHNRVA